MPCHFLCDEAFLLVEVRNGEAMKTLLYIVALLLLIPVHFSASAQRSGDLLSPIRQYGPRLGFTYIAQNVSLDDGEKAEGASPFYMQVGWQFESPLLEIGYGAEVLLECVALLGAVERGEVMPSATFLIGTRTRKGVEFAAGPTINQHGIDLVLATGLTMHSSNADIPLTLAYVPNSNGGRISLFTGYSKRK